MTVAIGRRLGALIVAASVVGAACSTSTQGYSRDTEGVFLESCTAKQSRPLAVCRCAYATITRQIRFDRYADLDKKLREDPEAIPDELVRIVAGCASASTQSGSG